MLIKSLPAVNALKKDVVVSKEEVIIKFVVIDMKVTGANNNVSIKYFHVWAVYVK